MERQPMKRSLQFSLIALNYWPFLYAALTLAVFFSLPVDVTKKIFCTLTLVYIIPPLLCRLVVSVFGAPKRLNRVGERGYWVWWFTSQCQGMFLRFPALEEIIRMVPGLYSVWLRLWGAEIGKFVYWGPGVKIVDRPFLRIEDFAVIGYGAMFTSHGYFFPLDQPEDGTPLIQFGKPVVRKRAIVGGIAGLSPGSEVAENELLPSSMLLAPFYLWKDSRRHARQSSPAHLE